MNDRVLQVNTMTEAQEITLVAFKENGDTVLKIGASNLADPASDDVELVKQLGGYVPVKLLIELIKGLK